MVGFVNDLSVKVKEEDNKQSVLESPEVNKSIDTLAALYIPELDDLYLSLADSFLDFDCLKDYIEENQEPFMADIKQEDLGMVGPENLDSGVVEKSLEMGQDDTFKGANVDDGFRTLDSGVVEKSFEVGRQDSCKGADVGDGFRKVDSGVVEESFEVGREDSCKETNGEDGVGNFGSLIEEEMGKVSLEGGLDENVGFDVNGGIGISEGVGDVGKDVNVGKCEMENGADGCKRSDENVGVQGIEVESGEMGNVGEKSRDIVGTEGGAIEKSCLDGNLGVSGNKLTIDSFGTKSREKMSDGEDSDSDSESETETSGSSSSSSSSSEDNDEEDDDENEVEEEGEMDVEEGEIRDSIEEEMTAWSDEDEEFGSGKAGRIMTANEVKVLPHVPPVDVALQPCHVTLPVGVVLSIVGAQVIVEGMEKHDPLNEGSILWITEKRSPLGIVDEIFGPVKNPYYIVRYNSENEVPAGIQQSTSISFVPEFVNHILINGNLYKKGYDASGENDEELSEEAEFSDDEKEAEYKRLQKMSKRGPKDQAVENRKRNKNKSKKRGGQWAGDQHLSATGPNERVVQSPSNQNQHFRPPLSVDQSNGSNSLRPVQAFAGGPGLVPVFPQAPQVPGFVAPSSGVWMNGIPCQPPQSAFPNGPTPNIILQLQQNQAQQPYHMPSFNGMPLQQFSTGQMMTSNFVFPGGQPGFGVGAFTPMNQMMFGQNNFGQFQAAASQNNFSQLHAAASQNNLSQSQSAINLQQQHAINMQGQHAINFGQSNAAVGMQGQHAPSFVNNGELGVLPNENQKEQNCSSQPLPATSASTGGPQKYNSGVNFGRGRNSYQRGGGRFGGGRGRGRGRGRQQPR